MVKKNLLSNLIIYPKNKKKRVFSLFHCYLSERRCTHGGGSYLNRTELSRNFQPPLIAQCTPLSQHKPFPLQSIHFPHPLITLSIPFPSFAFRYDSWFMIPQLSISFFAFSSDRRLLLLLSLQKKRKKEYSLLLTYTLSPFVNRI